jgi:hypothetical protein
VTVDGQVVLVGCDGVRVMSEDLATGKDIAVPDLHACASDILCTTREHAVVFERRARSIWQPGPRFAIDVRTGRRTEHVAAPSCDLMNSCSGGDACFTVDGGDVGQTLPQGGVRIVEPNGGRVVWEYHAPRGVPRLLHSGKREVLSVAAGATFAWTNEHQKQLPPRTLFPREVMLFRRGDPPVPLWTGTVRGRVVVGYEAGGVRTESWTVVVGGAETGCDLHGRFEAPLSTRGIITVEPRYDSACSCTTEPHAVELTPGTDVISVDLHAYAFEQACH